MDSVKAPTFASLTQNNLGTVRKLNAVLFPIKYSSKFYHDILKPEVEEFCKLVYYNDIPVGIVCCVLESKDGETALYLATLGILAPYRSRQLGSTTLELILDAATTQVKPKIDRIYLHVQTSNSDAKRFYERHGFVETGVQENYYKKIVPHDAWILEKRFT
ncbi:N-acetyltransferase domain-containing protein [Mycena kentingensis (nom. inval.)]|nr:N-acetyltransferase domain-containing protein [Mycena kentingensis (nom. inval.)]